jgi:hypothetical protein
MTLIDLAIRCAFFRGTMQELLQALIALRLSSTVRLSDWPTSPRSLSVKLRQLAPQLRSIGIEVEFQRERCGRFVTVTMSKEKEASARKHGSPLIGQRFRAYIEEQNRSVG